jgi:hypothetical protein
LADEKSPVAEIHICIKCEGDGFPSEDELALRNQLEDEIMKANLGTIVDSGGGRGVMDVFVEAQDVSAARSAIETLVERLGLADRTEVSV